MLAGKNSKTAEGLQSKLRRRSRLGYPTELMLAGNATHFGSNYAEDLDREFHQAAVPPASRPNSAYDRSTPDTQVGSGAIPNGTYACFTSTTARILIQADTYQVNEHSICRYKVGLNGTLTWEAESTRAKPWVAT